jgi:hypothetical protein
MFFPMVLKVDTAKKLVVKAQTPLDPLPPLKSEAPLHFFRIGPSEDLVVV